MNILKKTINSFFILITLFASTLVLPSPALAQTTQAWSEICASPETITFAESGQTETVNVATIQGIQCIIANVFSLAISAIGLVGFVMFIIGSFKYLLSGGNAKGIESAKTTFTYAVVGLVVAISSIIILNLVAGFTGVNTILNFVIPNSSCTNGQC